MDSDFPLHAIVVLLGILVCALYGGACIILRRYARTATLVGVGFVIGGIAFFAAISWPAFHDDYPGWLPATGTVAKFDESYHERLHERVLVSFHTASGQIGEAWRTMQTNSLWNAVPEPADEDGKKDLRKAVLHLEYNPQNLSEITIQRAEPWKYLLGGSIFGGVFVPLGLFLLVRPFLGFVRLKKLTSFGTRSTARITDIAHDLKYAHRVGKWMPLHYPWIIRAEWINPKTESKCVLESGSIWQDEEPSVQIGSSIDVLIDYSGEAIVYALDTRPLGADWEAKVAYPEVPKHHHKR